LVVGDEARLGAVVETAASILSSAFLAKLAGILEEPLGVVLLEVLVEGILRGEEPRLAAILGVLTLKAVIVNPTRIDLASVADEGGNARLVANAELVSKGLMGNTNVISNLDRIPHYPVATCVTRATEGVDANGNGIIRS
jgi:hypothetical protein